MDDLPQFPPLISPTAQRPLLGVTVLVVEDSRFACEALRLLCLKSGARIRRADTLAAARKHLRTYRPSVIIVDLGLPDGSGLDLIRDLHRYDHGIQAILATSGDDTLAHAAISAGAHGFLSKPLTSVAVFQQAVLKHLSALATSARPRAANLEIVHPDALAYNDDLRKAASSLSPNSEARQLVYLGRFVSGIARSAGDIDLQTAAETLLATQKARKPSDKIIARLASLLNQRLATQQSV
ncbi:response regulator [Cognatishimia sp. D5M38]|uniref:Response regulator n=1 Tax=Cognatishimia coralii TaxID=3083254 RepID=A0ABU8QGJ4_9RHOB